MELGAKFAEFSYKYKRNADRKIVSGLNGMTREKVLTESIMQMHHGLNSTQSCVQNLPMSLVRHS